MYSKLEIFFDYTVSEIEQELKYIFNVWSKNKNFELIFTEHSTPNSALISTNQNSDIPITYEVFNKPEFFSYDKKSNNEGFIVFSDESPDYMATAFYFLTCCQELDFKKMDHYSRFPFKESIQNKKSISHKNIVQECFDKLIISNIKFSHLTTQHFKSKIFVSHDIDSINGAIYQDGFFALKKFNLSDLFSIVINNVFIHPQWFNMDLIMKIESEYDFKSTFYWLVNKGVSKDGIKNADYNIMSKKVSNMVQKIEKSGWENGIHKSASETNFNEEMQKMPVKPIGNRFHFLKFHPHIDFHQIENAGLLFDSSLGYAEELGFRNGYGQPYQPYDFKNRRAFNFIECPLHMMDTTLHGYQKISSKEAFDKLIFFVEQNQYNCVLSLLWHNNYFTNYKYGDYFKLFKNMLIYFYENKFECITQSEIISKYPINGNSN